MDSRKKNDSPDEGTELNKFHILLVDDEPNILKTLSRILDRKGYSTLQAGNGEEALRLLEDNPCDMVISDLKMPRMDGITLLGRIKEEYNSLPVVLMTGFGTVQTAVETMKLGACEYLLKPCMPDELLTIIERQRELANLRTEVAHLRSEVQHARRFDRIIGKSSAMREVYRLIVAVSRNDCNVVIQGESGTGKELVARAIHNEGKGKKSPFVVINCGALSETLLESQLFGHKKGSFTGAVSDFPGLFRTAEGGTLFLDEITETTTSFQTKLLRAIQEKEFVPVGGVKPLSVDTRILAATNKNLEEQVEEGKFREDLYYRLNVVTIHLPPLRERREDIPLLVQYFNEMYSEIYHIEPKEISPAAMRDLTNYPWRGNVRELQNAIERAFALSENQILKPSNFKAANTRGDEDEEAFLSLDEMEKRHILMAMERSGGKKVLAAKLLGIERKQLYRKLSRYGY